MHDRGFRRLLRLPARTAEMAACLAADDLLRGVLRDPRRADLRDLVQSSGDRAGQRDVGPDARQLHPLLQPVELPGGGGAIGASGRDRGARDGDRRLPDGLCHRQDRTPRAKHLSADPGPGGDAARHGDPPLRDDGDPREQRPDQPVPAGARHDHRRCAGATDVQLSRRGPGAGAVRVALHDPDPHRRHQGHRPESRGSRAQPWRLAPTRLLPRDPAHVDAGHPRGLASGLRAVDLVLHCAGAHGRLPRRCPADPHLPASRRKRALPVRRDHRRHPVRAQRRGGRDLPVARQQTLGRHGLMERKIPRVMLILAILGFIYMLAPIVVVVMAGLTAGEFLTFPPQGLSLRWVAAFLQSESYLSAFFFSFKLALMTMIVSTILGTAVALFLSRTRFVGRAAMRAFFLSPVVLPGVVVGFALFAFYISTGIGLSRTIWGLWIGHILYSTPYVIGTVGAALAAYDVSLEEAARSLGASPWRAFRKVTLPNISQGIQAGSIFAFIVSFGQFEVSLFLSSPNSEPLPIAMYNSLRYQFDPSAAAAGIFAITLVIASVLLTNRLVNIRRLLDRRQ